MAERSRRVCEITQDSSNPRLIAGGEYAFVIADGYPVTDGHTLIIPKRHVTSFFELNRQERDSMLLLLDGAKAKLEQGRQPDGYNIGIKDGAAADQTVPHCHLHLIPRYNEDNQERGSDLGEGYVGWCRRRLITSLGDNEWIDRQGLQAEYCLRHCSGILSSSF